MNIDVNINLKTVNGESLIGTGNIVVGSGLTIGTTAITSGVNNRLLFQSAGVVQQSSNLSFSGTELSVGNSIKVLSTGLYPALNFENSIAQKAGMQMYANQLYFTSGAAATQTAILDTVGLKIGTGASAAAQIDMTAQSALSTYLMQRWRNSANSANHGTVLGDGSFVFGTYNNPNTKLSVTGTTYGIYGAGQTCFYADAMGSGTRIGYDTTARSSTAGAISTGVRGIADGGGATGINRGVHGQASGSGTNMAGYFDAINGTTNYALYIQRGNIAFQDNNHVELGTANGTKWGTASNQKQSWWGAAPIAQQILATGAGHTADDIIAALQLYGIFKQS